MQSASGSRTSDTNIALRLRIILGTLLTTSILFPALYQPVLTPLWEHLRQNSFYRLSTFETIWTVFLYALIELPMTVVFLNHPEWRFALRHKKTDNVSDDKNPGGGRPRNKPRGMRRPARRIREIITYIVPLLVMDLTMIKKFADVPLEDMLASGNYFSYQHDHQGFAGGTSLNSTTTASTSASKSFLLPTFHNMTLSSPLQTQRALPLVPPTSRRITLELVSAFLLYDTLFFLFHLLLHTTSPLKSWHTPHHSHAEMHPQLTNRLSVPERLGLILLANFSLNIIGAHVFTRTLFVPVFVWLLVEIHSGLDVPWGYEKILPKGWGGGARAHGVHHLGGRGGLEPYFSWWDGVVRWAGVNV